MYEISGFYLQHKVTTTYFTVERDVSRKRYALRKGSLSLILLVAILSFSMHKEISQVAICPAVFAK